MVAVHLLRFVHWLQDVEGRRAELRCFRTRAGHEVDFVVLVDGRPLFAVEAKLADRPADGNLRYFIERVAVPACFSGGLDFLVEWAILTERNHP